MFTDFLIFYVFKAQNNLRGGTRGLGTVGQNKRANPSYFISIWSLKKPLLSYYKNNSNYSIDSNNKDKNNSNNKNLNKDSKYNNKNKNNNNSKSNNKNYNNYKNYNKLGLSWAKLKLS